jgi:hypothetical protein
MITAMRRSYWLLYPAWILVCAMLFFAMRNREDPSRRPGRILSTDAAVRALAILHRPGYEAVHVAGEGNRWVVLCDRVPHTGLREAVVVELDAKDGRLLMIRRVKSEE